MRVIHAHMAEQHGSIVAVGSSEPINRDFRRVCVRRQTAVTADSHRVQFAARAAHSSPRECAVDIYAVGRRVCVLNTDRTTHDKNEVKRQKNVP